ncbi:MAG: DNA-formamidopyrimidine glycosylase family protein [Vicinamibacterales bacterium]
MPEGDTIFITARRLDGALAGRDVTGFHSRLGPLTALPVPGGVVGRAIDGVEARGKHLLIRLSGDLILRTHLRMHGAWHLYRPGERWRRAASRERVRIETRDWLAIGFDVPVAEWLTGRALARHPIVQALGPDLLRDDCDPIEARRRLAARGDLDIADALLDQRALAGLGNVYKSEVLFACRVHPFAKASALPAEVLDRLVDTARRMLAANVSPGRDLPGAGRRTTNRLRADESLWVYRRARQACHRCGTTIRMQRSGPDARSTYWCPACQAADDAGDTPTAGH